MKRKSKPFSPTEKKQFVIDWIMKASDRSRQRRALAEKWLEEREYSTYRYNVETCEDGSRLYLLRPTWLNRGFDFQVNLEGFRSETREGKGLTREMPSHKDVIHDLRLKATQDSRLRETLFHAVSDVFDCVEPDEVLMRSPNLRRLTNGLAIDKILRVLKWLFIEQDLTYWNQTGRNMLMSAIEQQVFEIEGGTT